jgi:tetratricopeptide (TPR) repeat protein
LVDALLAEGTLWLERLRLRLGPLSDDEIHIWAHHDREAMARHTGAVHVDFALPWRRELHIGSTAVPHRTLGHELAHVVLGERSDTFLRVPSRFIVLHNAAVTEGMAMALTPELAVDQGLTLREQAAAMRRAGMAPSLLRLFSMARFFGEEPGRAYVAAGALIEALVAEAGDDAPHAIERLYRGAGDLAVVSADVDGLIAAHERDLDAQPLPEDAVAFAALRFKRRSILEEVCEPDVVAVGERMRRLARTGDLAGAIDAAVALEGADADGTLSTLLTDVRAVGDVEGAIALLRRLVALAPSPSERETRRYALGVELWRAGHEREAHATWAAIDERVVVADLARQIVATRLLADHAVRLQAEARVARAALAYFISDAGLRDGARLAFARALGAGEGTESEAVVDIARYVLGRALVQEGAVEEAVALLRPLVAARRLPEAFHEQAVLGLATALVRWSAAGGAAPEALEEARTLLMQAAEAAQRPAMRLVLRDRAERVARAAAAPAPPSVSTATTDTAWGDRLLLGAGPAGSF